MIVFTVVASVLFIIGVLFLMKLTPEQIADDLIQLFSPSLTIHKQVKTAHGQKKRRKVAMELMHIKEAMILTGKAKQFSVICSVSVAFLIFGAFLAVIINNFFLIPILSIAFCLLPFIYAKTTINYYDKHIEQEMETALSIITTSYIRSDDIVSSIKENTHYLKPPINDVFMSFLGDTMISSDLKQALFKLKDKIDNEIFKEWVDTLIQCQNDRTIKETLLPIVSKLTDVRTVNNDLKTMLYEPRKEYYMMVAMLIGNIPLLYILNQDWYHTLINTLPGKLVLALCGVVILITAVLMMKYTKPIEYRR